MKKKLTGVIMSLALLLGVVAFVPATTFAETSKGLCQGANLTFTTNKDTTDCSDAGGANEKKLNDLIGKIVNILTVIVGIVAVIMIIVGGFKYITSGGDSNKVGSAKNTILYAVIGLVIVALAQFLVKFVLNKTKDVAS